jgi:hypothetical protein
MFFAVLIVCAMTEPVCDIDHAVWADRSPAIFADEADCRRAAMLRLMEIVPLIPGYKRNKLYNMAVRCERATLREGA